MSAPEEMTPGMSNPMPDNESNALLNRRTFITVGGAAIALSALLVGCSRKDKEVVKTGSMPQKVDVTTTTAPGSPDMDVTLLRTAQSIEVLAVETYSALLASSHITNAEIAPAFETFKAHHTQYADMLSKWVSDEGGQPFDKPNEYLKTQTIDPALDAIADEKGVLALAVEIENIAAQTYTLAGGTMTTPDLRRSMMSIAPSEARHMSVIYGMLATPAVPLPEMPTRDAAPKRALLPAG